MLYSSIHHSLKATLKQGVD